MENEERKIGIVGNYYGGLYVKIKDSKYYWSIENWDGHYWKEIPKSLFYELIEHDSAAAKQDQ